MVMSKIIMCGSNCGHSHEGKNSPTGCCPEHGPYMYFCQECHEVWQKKNPETSKAISKLAAGKPADIKKARKIDTVNLPDGE